jgi:hypothetical protein
MTFLQIPRNFKFKPIYPLPSFPQDGVSPSFSSRYCAFFFIVISLVVLFDESHEDLSKANVKKKRKLYYGSIKF